MSIQIIHKCDRCGATAETQEEFKALNLQNVGIGIQASSQNSTGPKFWYFLEGEVSSQAQWCMKCCIEVGFALPSEDRGRGYFERIFHKFSGKG